LIRPAGDIGLDETPVYGGVKKRPSTITDVASEAGVAIGTVSRYLNGFPVRRGNRDQIEAAIAKLSYRRNAVAAAMKTDLTHMIGLLVPSFDEFHAVMLEDLARSVRKTGRALLTYCHSNDRRIMGEALDFFATQRVDALIMDGAPEVRDRVETLLGQGMPIIFYNNDIQGVAADRVMVENKMATHRAVSHLIDLGHRRIAMLTGDMHDTSARLRLDGYEAALAERGIAGNPDYVVDGDWKSENAYQATRQLLALTEPPTAIFASNYGMAIGVLGWMKDQHLRVPDDLSLISFDDVALFRLHEVGITAIAQPLARIADVMTNLLVSRLGDGSELPARTMMLDCDIILRGSTKRIAPDA